MASRHILSQPSPLCAVVLLYEVLHLVVEDATLVLFVAK